MNLCELCPYKDDCPATATDCRSCIGHRPATFRARAESLMTAENQLSVSRWEGLAERAGVPSRTMATWRKGEVPAQVQTAIRIAKALGTSVEWLFEDEESEG